VNARFRILLIPITLGVVATILFLIQGGFGGGHGSLDQAIFAVGLPAVLATLALPTWPGDYLGLVLLPAIANVALWSVVVRALFALRRKRG
jgi:TRAP-type C4-dicarboxylate transport system permease small subunit